MLIMIQHLKPSTQRIIRLILLAVVIYLTILGATFNAVLAMIEFQPLTLLILAGSISSWLWWHRQRAWFRTPLDTVLPLWMLVFAISIVANPETTRRSLEALWYMGLYAAIWYVLSDLITQGFSRRLFSEAFLFSSIIVVAIGLLQTINLIISGLDNRPVSLIGNPNALGAYLVVLLPMLMMLIFMFRNRIARWLIGGYALAALFLLMATNSRGAWLGLAAAVIVLIMLLAHLELLSWKKLVAFWQSQPRKQQWLIGLATVGLFVAGLLVAIIIFRSFSSGGRSADLRTYLWNAAIAMFSEKPLTGHGLFTYGYHLARFDSIPPGQPHSHAHNLPLTILAELGLPGLLAMLISGFVIVRAGWHNWQALPPQDRPLWMGGVAALSGFIVHHLFDTPAMMPLIALVGLFTLIMVIVPVQPVRMTPAWRQRGHPIGMIVLWGVLIGLGFWHTTHYMRYYAILADALKNDTFAESAQALQAIIAADPYQPAYHLQQGYLFGLAASKGDEKAIQPALDAYARYLALEPYQATAWSNLAALHWQNNDKLSAISAIQQAQALAPSWQIFERQAQVYSGVLIGGLRIEPEQLESPWGINMARFQYLRDVIAPQFLPQVGW